MLDVQSIRSQFPALQQQYTGKPAIFFDNPGGTQVHGSVIAAMSDYLTRRNSNTHGVFETSRRTDETIDHARQAVADLLGADPDEVVFGNNMTSLTFHLSRSLSQEFGADDEIVVTRLDHDANVWPWVMLAEDSGAQVRWVDVDLETGMLDMEQFQSLIGPKTRLVAVGYASNSLGTINDVKTVVGWARAVGAYTFVDAVQYAPHGLIDVKKLDCDFLACSVYNSSALIRASSMASANTCTGCGPIESGRQVTSCPASGRQARRTTRAWPARRRRSSTSPGWASPTGARRPPPAAARKAARRGRRSPKMNTC